MNKTFTFFIQYSQVLTEFFSVSGVFLLTLEAEEFLLFTKAEGNALICVRAHPAW